MWTVKVVSLDEVRAMATRDSRSGSRDAFTAAAIVQRPMTAARMAALMPRPLED